MRLECRRQSGEAAPAGLVHSLGAAWMPLGKTRLPAVRLLGLCLAAFGASVQAEGSLVSLRRNAKILIGGEIMTDIVYRDDHDHGVAKSIEQSRTNLRLIADVHPNIRAFFKLDFSNRDRFARDQQILDEAMLVASTLGGTGFGLFAGKGTAPYGQDITLGIIQSYHHSANRADTAEGNIYIIEPSGDGFVDPAHKDALLVAPPLRPGQVDRAIMAGVSYEWDERWRFEAAVFNPDGAAERLRLMHESNTQYRQNDLSYAARMWWRPIEDLTIEASALAMHSSELGDAAKRLDLTDQARVRKNAWALSLGFDWRLYDWRVFGEFQQAWNWAFVQDYDVTIGQLGLAKT